MKQPTPASIQFAICVDSGGYEASLVLHKIYRVLPDERAAAEGDVRVVDESGEDYLYPAVRFAAIELPPPVRKLILQAA